MTELYDKKTERLILAKIFRDPDRIPQVLERLKPEDFYSRNNRILFRAIKKLFRDSRGIDARTVSDYLEENGELDKLPDGPATVADIAGMAAAAADVQNHVEIVQKKARLRRAEQLGVEIQQKANELEDPDKILSVITRNVQEIFEQDGQQARDIGTLFREAYEEIEERYEQDETPGYRTGFHTIDGLLGGLRKGQLIVLAGRPSMGKTSLARNIVGKICERYGAVTAFYTLEQTADELSTLFACQAGGIPPSGVLQGDVTEDELNTLSEQRDRLDDLPLYIEKLRTRDLDKLHSSVKRLNIQQGIDFVVVDYIQLLNVDTSYQSRQREIAEISHTLKEIAVAEDVVILSLSQLNRKVEDREPPRPQLSDLRSSGAIEQDADVVSLLYRPQYYGRDGDPELIVKKNRNGETGTATLEWRGEQMKFSDVEPVAIS